MNTVMTAQQLYDEHKENSIGMVVKHKTIKGRITSIPDQKNVLFTVNNNDILRTDVLTVIMPIFKASAAV